MGNKDYQCIISAPLAKKLIQKGFIVKNISPDRTNKDRVVFYFDKSDDIYKEILEYKKTKRV